MAADVLRLAVGAAMAADAVSTLGPARTGTDAWILYGDDAGVSNTHASGALHGARGDGEVRAPPLLPVAALFAPSAARLVPWGPDVAVTVPAVLCGTAGCCAEEAVANEGACCVVGGPLPMWACLCVGVWLIVSTLRRCRVRGTSAPPADANVVRRSVMAAFGWTLVQQSRNPLVLNYGDSIMLRLLFWLCWVDPGDGILVWWHTREQDQPNDGGGHNCAPRAEAGSAGPGHGDNSAGDPTERLRSDVKSAPDSPVSRTALGALAMELGVAHLAAAAAKVHPDWRSGKAIVSALSLDAHSTAVGSVVKQLLTWGTHDPSRPPVQAAAAAVIVILVEAVLGLALIVWALALLCPQAVPRNWRHPLRQVQRTTALCTVALHTTFALCLRLGWMPILFAAGAVALPQSAAMRRKLSRSVLLRSTLTVLACASLISATASFSATAGTASTSPSVVDSVLSGGFAEDWSMFAPAPPDVESALVVAPIAPADAQPLLWRAASFAVPDRGCEWACSASQSNTTQAPSRCLPLSVLPRDNRCGTRWLALSARLMWALDVAAGPQAPAKALLHTCHCGDNGGTTVEFHVDRDDRSLRSALPRHAATVLARLRRHWCVGTNEVGPDAVAATRVSKTVRADGGVTWSIRPLFEVVCP